MLHIFLLCCHLTYIVWGYTLINVYVYAHLMWHILYIPVYKVFSPRLWNNRLCPCLISSLQALSSHLHPCCLWSLSLGLKLAVWPQGFKCFPVLRIPRPSEKLYLIPTVLNCIWSLAVRKRAERNESSERHEVLASTATPNRPWRPCNSLAWSTRACLSSLWTKSFSSLVCKQQIRG